MRRRQRTINTQTWEPAIVNVNKLERAMVNVMIKPGDMTYDEVLDCLVEPGPLKLLRDAFPYMSMGSQDQSRQFEFTSGRVTFMMDFLAMKVVPPKQKLLVMQHTAPRILQFTAMMDKLLGISAQCNKLRDILYVFQNKDVTAGAARHYWPTLQSLLPSDHAFFQVKGDRFKDVDLSYETTELLREAPEIVAKGLLCDPNANGGYKQGKTLIRVMTPSNQMHYLFTGPGA